MTNHDNRAVTHNCHDLLNDYKLKLVFNFDSMFYTLLKMDKMFHRDVLPWTRLLFINDEIPASKTINQPTIKQLNIDQLCSLFLQHLIV